MIKALYLIPLACVYAWQAAAQAPQEIFDPPGAMWLRPGTGVTTAGAYYGPSAPGARWVVSQWNTPENLPPFHDDDTRNAALHVHLYPDHSYLLEQDGSTLSCDRTYATGVKDVHEFDLFVGPNNGVRPTYPQATTGVTAIIGGLAHLYHRITVQPLMAQVLDTACPVTRAVFLTSITLNDPVEKQTLFYQLRLGIVDARDGRVLTALPQPFWFARGQDRRAGAHGYFGFDDSITTYGQPAATVPAPSSYAIDLLPRLTAVLKQGEAFGMDPDLTHWKVSGTYHGEIIWGHMHARTQWSGFSLAAQP